MNISGNPLQPQQPPEPLVDLILKLATANRRDSLKQIQRLIYQPFNSRYQLDLFSILPNKEAGGVGYYALRQAYRLVGPLMAQYPRTVETGNFGWSLGELERVMKPNLIERKLLIIERSLHLHLAESTLLSLVKLMQQNDILINWSQMVRDAKYWNEKVMVRWYEGLMTIRDQKKETK